MNITPKRQYRIDNIIKYTLQSFYDYRNKNLDNTLNNSRKACEGICRVVILHFKGDNIGERIIQGEIDTNRRPLSRGFNREFKPPLLYKLLRICEPLLNKKPLYYRFQDVRFGGNNASHDAMNVQSEVNEEDVELCINQFKQILNWFWTGFLNSNIPDAIKNSFEGKIDKSILTDLSHIDWDDFYRNCDGFSNEQKFILIAPPTFGDLTENQLEILGRINWKMILDFNPKSKTTGLYKAFVNLKDSKIIKPITIENNGEKNLISHSNLTINWVFANGIDENVKLSVTNDFKDWKNKKYIQFLEKIIYSLLLNDSTNIHFIFLWDEVKYLRPIIQKIDLISNSKLTSFSLLYSNVNKLLGLREFEEDYDVSLFYLSLNQLVDGIASVKHSNKKRTEKAILVPGRSREGNDVYLDISNEYISFLDKNLEIVFRNLDEFGNTNFDDNNFYKGNPITWKEIAVNKDVERIKLSNLKEKVKVLLESSKGAYTIELLHKPGAGGTTLAKRLAYSFHKKYPTLILTKFERISTQEAIFKFSEIVQKPIIVIVEGFQVEDTELRNLARGLSGDKKHIVFIYIKRFFKDKIRETNKIVFLSDKTINLVERDRFISKYKEAASNDSKMYFDKLGKISPNYCEVIDFALAAYEEDYSAKNVENYVFTYLDRLPSNQLQFIAFVSLIYYYTQNSTNENWFSNLFNDSLIKELEEKPLEERFIKKLLIQELDEEGNETGFWRPRFNRFGKEILELVTVGLNNREKKKNWKENLNIWAIDLIKECKVGNDYLNFELRSLFKNLFLNRDYEDTLGKDEEYDSLAVVNRKFARIFRDIQEKEKQKNVFETLINLFPDEAHFRGHLGRFYFETAISPSEFNIANDEIARAIDLGNDDFNLWHLKGMCNRRVVEFLIRQNREDFDSEKLEDLENLVKEHTVEAISDFNKSKELNPYNLHCHTAQIQLLIKVINFGKQLKPEEPNEVFICNTNNIWYETRLDEVFYLIDEAESVIELSKSLEQGKNISRTKEMISTSEARTFELLGNFSRAIGRFKSLSETSDRSSRPYFRKMYVYSTLASKVGNNYKLYKKAWIELSEYEFLSLKKAIESNIREEPENPQNYKMWLNAVRGKNYQISFDECLSIVKSWYDNSQHNELANLQSTYYRYVLHACKAISSNVDFVEIDVTEAKKYLKECSNKTENDKFSFEWFGLGHGLNSMVNHSLLGRMDKETGFFLDNSKLCEVEGIIVSIANRQRGRIKLKCGLDAFFAPINGGFEKGKDETTKVRFYISFRYNELVAWEVRRFAEKKDISPRHQIEIEFFEEELIQAKEVEKDIIVKVPQENKEKSYFYSNRPKPKKFKIIKKIDLSQFEKYKK